MDSLICSKVHPPWTWGIQCPRVGDPSVPLLEVNMLGVKLKPGKTPLQVVVRARPLTATEERHGCKDIIRVQDGRVWAIDFRSTS